MLPGVLLEPTVANYVSDPPAPVRVSVTSLRSQPARSSAICAQSFDLEMRCSWDRYGDHTGRFRHFARWNRADCRMEMRLHSTSDHCVDIPRADISLQFAFGETIHTENSYKFSRETLCALLDSAGFAIDLVWTDPPSWYSLTLAIVR